MKFDDTTEKQFADSHDEVCMNFLHSIDSIFNCDSLIEKAPLSFDRQHNTDYLMSMLFRKTHNIHSVACRVRSNRHYQSTYVDEITFRDKVDTGLTEFKKVLDGYGDFYLYGISTANKECIPNTKSLNLVLALLLDLNIFREYYVYLKDYLGISRPGKVPNTHICAFSIIDMFHFDSRILIHSSFTSKDECIEKLKHKKQSNVNTKMNKRVIPNKKLMSNY